MSEDGMMIIYCAICLVAIFVIVVSAVWTNRESCLARERTQSGRGASVVAVSTNPELACCVAPCTESGRWILLAAGYMVVGMFIIASSGGRRGETWQWMNIHSSLPWLVSLPFLLVPALVALRLRKTELKLELIAAGADAASDIIGLLTSRFYSPSFAGALFYFITFSPLVGVLSQFGRSILTTCVRDIIYGCRWPCLRLSDNGIHQVFEESLLSPEKFAINLVATICLALLCLVMPFIMPPLGVAKALVVILLGACLHSVRWMQVPRVARFFAHLARADQASFDDGWTPLVHGDASSVPAPAFDTLEAQRADVAPESPQELRSHNHAMFVELVFESIPSLSVNAVNLYCLRHNNTSNETPWTAIASMTASFYMIFRLAYKFAYYRCILNKSFDEIDVSPITTSGAAGSVVPIAAQATVAALTA